MGDRRKLHNGEFCNLYSSPNIIRMIKSRSKWAGHVAQMRRGLHIGYWWGSQKDRDHCEDQDIGRWAGLDQSG
jgi:hypothetical protein